MRMSCNGCRVLRKGCSENCSIRPCLEWIKSPDSQANATLFLAKFYGRAGLLNLIEAGPENLRPGIFRSLLYEACGRVINPVYGSVGLMWSGNWAECQAAVDAVLKGLSITHTSSSSESSHRQQQPISPLKTYDIRHVSKDTMTAAAAASAQDEDVVVDKVKRTRTRFKRSKRQVVTSSHSYNGSWMSGHFENNNDESKEDESMFSGETVEGSLVNQTTKKVPVFKFTNQTEESGDVGLELTLGLAPAAQSGRCKNWV